MAVWSYNSGVHRKSDNATYYGVGWLNNPANPIYPANRNPFLRNGSTGDAANPWNWPYQEKVMGWIEYPQLKGSPAKPGYSQPTFGASKSGRLELPEDVTPKLFWFCNSTNACTPNTANPCPSVDLQCWFHGVVNWANCTTACAVEYAPMLGWPEPAVKRIYPTACAQLTASGAIVVDDLDDSSLNLLGCPTRARGGKFTLRVGSPPGAESTVYYGMIDLHQIGAGYQGHMWFTHMYDPAVVSKDGPTAMTMKELHGIVGTWTPDLASAGRYDILVHIPSHGAQAAAQYVVFGDNTDASKTCTVQQASNENDDWVYLGNYPLGRAARVQLGNLQSGANGSVDIAYDSMAFVPTSGDSGHACATPYQ
jgi:hypothetical protein